MAKLEYDQETKDLSHLAARRVSEAVQSVLQICNGPDQALQVALMAAGTALGNATGAVSAKYGCTHEEAKALVFNLIMKPVSEETSNG